MVKITLKESDMTEFVGQLIDIFEDFLEERGITLMNEDKKHAIADGEDPDTLCVIYGDDYADLRESIEDTLNNWSDNETTDSRLRSAITDYCRERIHKCVCREDDCEFCSLNRAYELTTEPIPNEEG